MWQFWFFQYVLGPYWSMIMVNKLNPNFQLLPHCKLNTRGVWQISYRKPLKLWVNSVNINSSCEVIIHRVLQEAGHCCRHHTVKSIGRRSSRIKDGIKDRRRRRPIYASHWLSHWACWIGQSPLVNIPASLVSKHMDEWRTTLCLPYDRLL